MTFDDTERFTSDGCEVGPARPIPQRIEIDAEDYYRCWYVNLLGIASGHKSRIDYEVVAGSPCFRFNPRSFTTHESVHPTRYFRVYSEPVK